MPVPMLPPVAAQWPADLDLRAAGRVCKVCGAVLSANRRGYCSPDHALIGRRDYMAAWQRSQKQQRRLKRWRKAHREERAEYNRTHYQGNRDRYRAGMQRAHQARKLADPSRMKHITEQTA